MMKEKRDQKEFLDNVLNVGLESAASSFSRFLGTYISCCTKSAACQYTHATNATTKKGELNVLITHLIGDIPGKSFLVLNEHESQVVLASCNVVHSSNPLLRDSLLLEVDNIVSASFIATLSNALKVEMYGDVPLLRKMDAKEFNDMLLFESGQAEDADMICINTHFDFPQNENVAPEFFWIISNKVFQKIPQHIEKLN